MQLGSSTRATFRFEPLRDNSRTVGNSSLRGVTEDLPVTYQLRHGRGSYFEVRTALRLRTVQNDLWTVTFVPAILNVLRTRIRAAHLAWSMSSWIWNPSSTQNLWRLVQW